MRSFVLSAEFDFDRGQDYHDRPDKPEEACGIFGVYAPGEDVSTLTYFGLHALQHRGQESAGIAVADGNTIIIYKDMGLVPQVFDERNLASLQGDIAIGHTRYSTTGSNHWENAQPIYKTFKGGSLALAHNGNLTNTKTLRENLSKNGQRFRSTSDSEVIASLIASYSDLGIEGAIAETMKQLEGAYSLVILTEDKLFAVRDPYGIRPLVIGKLAGNYIIASESCALNITGADYVRDVMPGELVVINGDGLKSIQAEEPKKLSLCVFEFIYFARPDTRLLGRLLYSAREAMGVELAKEAPANADLVIGVPDSGVPAAIGYSQQSGIPYREGLVKNRYIGRTFIQPTQNIRQAGIKLKLNPLCEVIGDKSIVVVDDSIVRGNTSKKLIQMLRDAGAREVHVRISSPPVKWPCFYGIDTADQGQLIAANNEVEKIREFIGADSLSYLSMEGLIKATESDKENFCRACFDGEYPIDVSEELKITKLMLEEEEAK